MKYNSAQKNVKVSIRTTVGDLMKALGIPEDKVYMFCVDPTGNKSHNCMEVTCDKDSDKKKVIYITYHSVEKMDPNEAKSDKQLLLELSGEEAPTKQYAQYVPNKPKDQG